MASMAFCDSCNNMLYPKEDKVAKKLVYVCRRCGNNQESENPVVIKNELIKSAKNQLEHIPDDIITDPTLQRATVDCPKCGQVGAVFFMAKVTPSDERLKLIYVCTNTQCVHKWQD